MRTDVDNSKDLTGNNGAAADTSLVSHIAREPTVHFLLLAGLLFAVYRLLAPTGEPELIIDWQEVEARILISELNLGRSLDTAERAQIEAAVIDDYVLVREAYAMGLENDPRINEMLVQKVRHVLSGEEVQPTDAELAQYHAANRDRYRIPPRLTVEELVFVSREPLPEDLLQQLRDGASVESLQSRALMTQSTLPRVTHQDLASIFSREFADTVFAATGAGWIGPFLSNRGQHFLRIEETFAATELVLQDILDQVRIDWLAEMEEQRLAEAVAQLRQQYQIQIINRPAP